MHSLLARLGQRLAGTLPTLVLAEAHDARVLQAARRLRDRDLARVILLGPIDAIRTAAADLSLDGLEQIDPSSSPAIDDYVRHYLASRPRTRPSVAQRLVRRPLYFAGAMLAAGDADAMLAGAANPTARVIEACLATVGLDDEADAPSSAFLMLLPGAGNGERALIYADCAVQVAPDTEQLAEIAVSAAATAQALLDEPPRVALLSFSSHGSANHALARKVADAAAIAARRLPGVAFDGELQADAALDTHVARIKLDHPGPVAGRANVLVFPDLGAGNIAYKLTQYLAGARAIGPLLLGFSKPVADVSRGASVDDIVDTAIVALAASLPR